MRLPFSRVHRGFAEFDRFDDQTCVRLFFELRSCYTRQYSNADALGVLIAVSYVIALAAIGVRRIRPVGDAVSRMVNESATTAIMMALLIAIFSIGPVAGLIVRDALIRRLLLRHLSRLECHKCGYSLLGIAPIDGFHTCPECGTRIVFEEQFKAVLPESPPAR